LELAWTNVPIEKNSIAGDAIIPFVSNEYEGFDINNLEDWMLAETLISQGVANLPLVDIKKYTVI
jgi:N-acylneuraminate cytidylyltransferase